MTVATTAPANVPTTTPSPTPELALSIETGGAARGGVPVALVWAGVAVTLVWVAALGFTAYVAVSGAVHQLFG